MEIFAPIEKKKSLSMEFIFSKKIFQQFVHGAIKYFFLFFFFFFDFCFYRWNFFDFKISEKKSTSTASKIIEIFIHFQSRFPTNVFFLKAMLS